MDNKLSELSKPVAYVVTGGRAHHDWPFIIKSTAERARDERKDGATVKPLYSQEYVSALLADCDSNQQNYHNAMEELRIERAQRQAADQRIAELEGQLQSGFTPEALAQEERAENAEQRVAELEAVKADASRVFKEIGNELGCNPDNESIMMAIDALKDRLATPVRLPVVLMGYQSDDYRIGFMEGVEKSGDEVRAAGFTVEGDEQ